MATKKHPSHSIIDAPWTWRVTDFHYHREGNDLERPDAAWIDLTLWKDGKTRRLRFLRPRSIKLDPGFPACPGLFIDDVSKDQLEDLRVHVGDFENGGGGMAFWAADVIDLDKAE